MSNQWRLYAMAARDGEYSHFKVGISTNPIKRVASVQTGCPFPINEIAMVDLPGAYVARRAEAAMHYRLAEYATSGEWFKFHLKDPDHKQAFNTASREVIDPIIGAGWSWSLLNVASLKKLLADESKDIAAGMPSRTVAHAYRMAKGLPMW